MFLFEPAGVVQLGQVCRSVGPVAVNLDLARRDWVSQGDGSVSGEARRRKHAIPNKPGPATPAHTSQARQKTAYTNRDLPGMLPWLSFAHG